MTKFYLQAKGLFTISRKNDIKSLGYFFETAADAWFYVAAAECGDLAELSRYLYTFTQQLVESMFADKAVRIGDQSKYSCMHSTQTTCTNRTSDNV